MLLNLASSERTQADMVGMEESAVDLLRVDPSNCAETRTRFRFVRMNEMRPPADADFVECKST